MIRFKRFSEKGRIEWNRSWNYNWNQSWWRWNLRIGPVGDGIGESELVEAESELVEVESELVEASELKRQLESELVEVESELELKLESELVEMESEDRACWRWNRRIGAGGGATGVSTVLTGGIRTSSPIPLYSKPHHLPLTSSPYSPPPVDGRPALSRLPRHKLQ
ncbi:Protein CBG00042 [Caenorhabditis briggsae]|uniref:Protein CBG00042 n=1 Tax=Caenorhabditis briggsae TaxID=6238 RepID=A8WM71_CAEBR|nr:Protein CBG00042 [Caenorhabditis briggsae]CAP21575.2 Protein CBG00042 [Caenorhabditis briggsae]